MYGLNASDTVANEMMKEISSAEKVYDDDRIETNSVYMMATLAPEVLKLR